MSRTNTSSSRVDDIVLDGSEPSVHWMELAQPRERFTGSWMTLSPNWSPSGVGGGKITFLWGPDGEGQVYSNIGRTSVPHRININTEWAPYGQWYRIEWHVRWASSAGAGDGIVRWWVNGALNGDYNSVRYPECCFQQFEFAPTLQSPPPAEQYTYIDHTYVSTP